MNLLTLEDARIIERFYLIEQRHETPPVSYRTRLALTQILLALATFERHLPVPLILPFEHYVKLGGYRAQGMTYIPFRDPIVSKLTGFDQGPVGGGSGDQPANGERRPQRG